MPGSATLDPTNCLDDLITVVDELREDLNTSFGVRAHCVYTVRRVWDGGFIGEGDFTDTETEITPKPLVQPFVDLRGRMEECGFDESGMVKITEVSLTYTQAELDGGPSDEATEWLWRIREGHGQAQRDMDFILERSPYPDRSPKHMNGMPGWVVWLRRASE